MIIDSQFDGIEQSGLTMIASSSYQCYAFRDSHSLDLAVVQRAEGDAKLGWALEGEGPEERVVADAALSREDAAVADERDETILRETALQVVVIFGGSDPAPREFLIHAIPAHGVEDMWEVLCENRGRGTSEAAPSCRG